MDQEMASFPQRFIFSFFSTNLMRWMTSSMWEVGVWRIVVLSSLPRGLAAPVCLFRSEGSVGSQGGGDRNFHASACGLNQLYCSLPPAASCPSGLCFQLHEDKKSLGDLTQREEEWLLWAV